MRKGKSGHRAGAAKGKGPPKSVEEYLARVPETARGMLEELRAAIRSVVPAEATEIISYRIPAIKYKGVLVWYAAFANHCSLFPTAAVIGEFKNELKGFTLSKGTTQFPTNKPLPVPLIKKIVKARVKQVEKQEA